MADWELLPKEDAARPTEAPPRPEPPQVRWHTRRLVLAFAVAAISDTCSFWVEFVPPLQWLLDVVTAFLLFLLLGRQWLILPGLIAEAIPGIAVFPFWVLVVASIALWGKISKQPQQRGTKEPRSALS